MDGVMRSQGWGFGVQGLGFRSGLEFKALKAFVSRNSMLASNYEEEKLRVGGFTPAVVSDSGSCLLRPGGCGAARAGEQAREKETEQAKETERESIRGKPYPPCIPRARRQGMRGVPAVVSGSGSCLLRPGGAAPRALATLVGSPVLSVE